MGSTIRNLIESTEAHLIDLNAIVEASEENLDAAMKKVFEHTGPAMIEIITDPLLT